MIKNGGGDGGVSNKKREDTYEKNGKRGEEIKRDKE